MPHHILSLQHVYVSRGGPPVLHDINLHLMAGEHLAILGPNGCGKSTLLKTITCELYPLVTNPGGQPTSISIFGRSRWDLTLLRQRLGVVSADLPGKPTLHTTGFDAILTGFFSASTLWPNLEITGTMRARAEDLLHQVGAESLRNKLVGQMSAGQQRRIMIARALAGSRTAAQRTQGPPTETTPPDINPGARSSQAASRPGKTEPSQAATPHPSHLNSSTPEPSFLNQDMLLLDEPSNALDIAAQSDLRNLLRELARQGTAILLITHHTADIIPEIDRVLLMSEGRIVADGPKRELLTAPALSNLFGSPITITEREGFFHTW